MKLTDTKYVIICGLMLLVCISIYARNVSVSGHLVDKYNGEPLIGACVYATYTDKKDSLITVADTAGLFTVSVPENQLLRFRYIGYKDTFALAKSNLLIELADGGDWKNPLWIVDSLIADVKYPDIWYQSPFGDVSLESLVCEAMPVLREYDIEKVDLIDSIICFGNILYTGLCRVDTKPITVQVIVDGENLGIIQERPGRFAGKDGAICYATNTLLIDSVIDAVALDREKILPTSGGKAKKMLIVTTDRHYLSVSRAGFKPYQYDNGDDYVSDGRYRIVDGDGKIGYATTNNVVIISPRFAFGFPFKNGRAKVTDSGHLKEVKGSDGEYHYWVSDNWYWIDKMGNRFEIENEADR